MLEGIVKGLFQWLYGLFLDLVSYCANALLGVMSTDLYYFENSVPIVMDLYYLFVIVGRSLLLGNCAFQAMKAMLAGLGFETESPAVLLICTGIFGFLLLCSKQICTLALNMGKQIIDLIGMPTQIELVLPDEVFSVSTPAGSW